MRKLLLIFLIGLFFIFPLALIAMLSLAIEDHPRINRKVILTPEHIGRAKQIVDAHRYWIHPGMLVAARVTSADADLAANYLAHRLGKGSAQVTLTDRKAIIRLRLPGSGVLPGGYVNPYLNLRASVVEAGAIPQLRSVQIGKLSLRDALTDVIVLRFVQWLRRSPEYRAAFDALHLVRVSQKELSVVYRWERSEEHTSEL